MVWGNTGPDGGGGSQNVSFTLTCRFCGLAFLDGWDGCFFVYKDGPWNLEIFWNFHLKNESLPWIFLEFSQNCGATKTVLALFSGSFKHGVFVVYWEYWISILTMRSMSSLTTSFPLEGSTWSIGLLSSVSMPKLVELVVLLSWSMFFLDAF